MTKTLKAARKKLKGSSALNADQLALLRRSQQDYAPFDLVDASKSLPNRPGYKVDKVRRARNAVRKLIRRGLVLPTGQRGDYIRADAVTGASK